MVPPRVRRGDRFVGEADGRQQFEARSPHPFRVVIADHDSEEDSVVVIDAVLDGQNQGEWHSYSLLERIISSNPPEVPHSPGRVSRQKQIIEVRS